MGFYRLSLNLFIVLYFTTIALALGCSSETAVEAAASTAAGTDTDDDGVADADDLCPEEAATIDTNGNGCEDGSAKDEDADGDGVNNDDDDCPTVAAEADTDGDGCEDETEEEDDDEVTDTDGDGIDDVDDLCVSEVPTQDTDSDGCEDDTDGDGVNDISDSCSTVAATTDADGDGCEDDNSSPESISMCISAQDSYDFDGASGGYSEGATATRISFDGVDGVDYYVVKLQLDNNEEGGDDRYLYALIDINIDEWSEVNFEYNASEIEDSFAWETEYEVTESYSVPGGYYFCSFTNSSEMITCYFDTLVSDSANSGYDSESNMVASVAAAESTGDIISDWTEYGYIEAIGPTDEVDGLPSCFEDNDQPVAVDFCMSEEDSYDEVDGDGSGYSDLYTATRISFDGVEGVEFYVVKLLLANNASGDSDYYLYYLINIDDESWEDTYYYYDSSSIDEDFVWTLNSSPRYHYCSYSDASLTISCYFDTAVFDSRDNGADNESNIYAFVAAANSENEIVSDWNYFGHIDSPATLKTCSD